MPASLRVRLRLITDIAFALAGMFAVTLLFFAALIAVLYLTKIDLGIDLFIGHFLEDLLSHE